MAKRYAKTIRYPVSAEKLLDILLDPDFQVAREKAQGSLEVTVKELSRNDSEMVYEVHTVDHAKGLTGIDKSKTETAVSVYTWDLVKQRCRWTWDGPHSNRVKVWGHLILHPAGNETDLEGDFNVDVSVPLVGGKIEKEVIKETEKGWDRYEAVVRRFIAERA
jgi:hypothetical protein